MPIFTNFDIFTALKDLLTPKEKIELEQLNNTYIEKRNKLSPILLQKELDIDIKDTSETLFDKLNILGVKELI